MKIHDCMASTIWTIDEDCSLREAAVIMNERDIGARPVARGDRVVGMLTDRDLAIRGIGRGADPDVRVAEAMSSAPVFCFQSDEISDALRAMGDQQIRRLIVADENNELVGVVALSDLLKVEAAVGLEALAAVIVPSQTHSQSLH
ncbi:MAG: CBS domain-containing protein [Sphingomonadaceae bacterium]